MSAIYRFESYRDFLNDRIQRTGLSARALCAQARIHPSFFSRAMKEKAPLSDEQLFRIGGALGLTPVETDYLLLLGQLGASADESHRSHLRKKIDRIRREQLKVAKRVEEPASATWTEEKRIAEYFESPLTAQVLMLLTIPRLRSRTEDIAARLSISAERLEAELARLRQLGMIEKKGESHVVRQEMVHLDESHPISPRNHVQWRLEAVERLRKRGADHEEDYHLSVCLSADREAVKRIREAFQDFVVKAQRIVRGCERPDDAFLLNFDLARL